MRINWTSTSGKTTTMFELFHEKLRDVWTPKTTSYIYLIGGTNNNMKFDHQQFTLRGIMSPVRQFISQITQTFEKRTVSVWRFCYNNFTIRLIFTRKHR